MVISLGNVKVGEGLPPVFVAEIGVNHDGQVDTAMRLVKDAWLAGAHMVKFQKRTPRLCVPKNYWNTPRESRWGTIPYIEFRERMEFGRAEFERLDALCKGKNIPWFASCWDVEALEFIEEFDPPCHKVASPCLTDKGLLEAMVDTGRPLIVSTGMSSPSEIAEAVSILQGAWERVIICHTTSVYPTPKEMMNLRYIRTLKEKFLDVVVGYSGHERGIIATFGAIALGASYIERHITYDRMKPGDHSASIEPWQFYQMGTDGTALWASLGDGVKRVYDGEKANARKLRKYITEDVHAS